MGMTFIVDVFVLENGDIPAETALLEFESVSPKLRDKMRARIEMLEHSDNHSGNIMKKIDDKLWCLRTRHSTNHARLFFTFGPGRMIYLLSGYVKKTNKIPAQELQRARALVKALEGGIAYAK